MVLAIRGPAAVADRSLVLFSWVLGKLSRRAHRTVAAAADRESQQIPASLGTDLGDTPRPLDTTLISRTYRALAGKPKVESFVNFILDKAKSSGPN